jgi:hypothetical protein
VPCTAEAIRFAQFIQPDRAVGRSLAAAKEIGTATVRESEAWLKRQNNSKTRQVSVASSLFSRLGTTID